MHFHMNGFACRLALTLRQRQLRNDLLYVVHLWKLIYIYFVPKEIHVYKTLWIVEL